MIFKSIDTETCFHVGAGLFCNFILSRLRDSYDSQPLCMDFKDLFENALRVSSTKELLTQVKEISESGQQMAHKDSI